LIIGLLCACAQLPPPRALILQSQYSQPVWIEKVHYGHQALPGGRLAGTGRIYLLPEAQGLPQSVIIHWHSMPKGKRQQQRLSLTPLHKKISRDNDRILLLQDRHGVFHARLE